MTWADDEPVPRPRSRPRRVTPWRDQAVRFPTRPQASADDLVVWLLIGVGALGYLIALVAS